MDEKHNIKELIYAFSEADIARLFNFTSGHLGTLEIPDKNLLQLAYSGNIKQSIKRISLLVKELSKFIFFTFIPIKSVGLIVRTMLRFFYNKKVHSVYGITVISLGGHSYNSDPYFGILLSNIDVKFNYLKVVGGFSFKSKDFQYIEAGLSYLELFKLALSIAATPFLSLFYLIRNLSSLVGFKARICFMIFALKDINSGVFNLNKVIVRSISSYLIKNKKIKLLYPLEGRNWEKNIVKCANEENIHTIGYLHCALTPRHLSLTNPFFYRELDVPSVMISPGEMAIKLLTEIFPNTLIRCGFFLRGSKNRSTPIRKDQSALLFALTGSIHESCEILDYLVAYKLNLKYKIIIRLNPNTSSYTFLTKYVEKYGLSLYKNEGYALPCVCFFRSSSVGLDYLRLNVLPVYLSLNEVISNNVFELDNRFSFESLMMNSELELNIERILNRAKLSKFDGKNIADYYLNQSYIPSQLPALLN